MSETVKRMLFEAEKSLFNNKMLNNNEWVDSIVHDDFMEITSKGEIIRKNRVLQNVEHCHRDLDFHVNNFEYIQLNATAWIIHYIVGYGEMKQYHSSTWIRNEDGDLQLIFHQVSNLEGEVELVPFK